eukprot:1064547-Pleurochrysis_carterae.AAC.1
MFETWKARSLREVASQASDFPEGNRPCSVEMASATIDLATAVLRLTSLLQVKDDARGLACPAACADCLDHTEAPFLNSHGTSSS